MIQHWDIQATTIELIQGGQLALVWKIHTADGPFCLKRIHRPEKRLYFLFTLKIILPKGMRVPSIIPSKVNQLYTKHGPFLFVVYEWIEGRPFELQCKKTLK